MLFLHRPRFKLIKRARKLTSCAVMACLLYPAKTFALTEEELQVALLLKVAHFTQWPQTDDQEFKFCLYRGKGYEVINDMRQKKPKIGAHQVNFVFLEQNTPTYLINQCSILFITEGSAVETKQVLRRASYSPTLTVGTLRGFANLGGMVELVKVKKRYNFRINLIPVKQSQLSISAPLLEISTVIKEGE